MDTMTTREHNELKLYQAEVNALHAALTEIGTAKALAELRLSHERIADIDDDIEQMQLKEEALSGADDE